MADNTDAAPNAVVLDALPHPCCATGRELTVAWVTELVGKRDSLDLIGAEAAWTTHALTAHRITGVPQTGCPWCHEWVAVIGPGSPDLSHALGYEAAGHYARHAVLDPVALALGVGLASGLYRREDLQPIDPRDEPKQRGGGDSGEGCHT